MDIFSFFKYNNARPSIGDSLKGKAPKRSPVESILKMTKTAWPKTRTTDNQITLLFVFHHKWTLHRMLDPACRGYAPPVKKCAHACGNLCLETGYQRVARPDGYRSKTVSCRVMVVRSWQREWRYSPGPTRGLLPVRRRLAPTAGSSG